MIVLANITFDLYRSNVANAITAQAKPMLVGQFGHIEPALTKLHEYMQSAIKDTYHLRVESGTDIHDGDVLTNMVNITTGSTWPSEQGGVDMWRVIQVYDDIPGPLGYRKLLIGRFVTAGPAPL